MSHTIHFTSHERLATGSAFFLDYLKAPEKISSFFPNFDAGTLSVESLVASAPAIAAQHRRSPDLVAALHEQNVVWGAQPATLKNIALLAHPDAVAVVGGQQAGLFGGAALSVHKAITILRLAEEMTKAGVAAVPIFWMASEDHDFAEVSRTAVLARDGARAELRYESDVQGNPSVGAITLGADVARLHDELADLLPETEFTPHLLTTLRECYREGTGWCDAFAAWMLKLFSRFGLVTVDPRHPKLKRLAAEIYGRTISHADEIARRVATRSRELEAAGYHAQVAVTERSFPLFVEIAAGRSALTRDENKFQVKNAAERFTDVELLTMSENAPERLSPNALLRSVVQDALFPTVAHVVGPAEIAYLAQSQPIYDLFDMASPVRWHRSSVTLVESRHVKTFEKHGLQFEDVLAGESALVRRIIAESPSGATLATFADVKANMNAQLDRLQAALRASDPPLADALERGREKTLHQIDGLETRFVANRAQSEDAMRRQIERATTSLYPRRVPQERDINILTFLARYGESLIDRLHAEMRLDPARHQWMTI
jgi:bacillithiol synthase